MSFPALTSITVLDLGQIYNGPYCTMLLRQLGARVIKIEPSDGEPIRWRGDGVSESQAFSLLNGGKEGMTLNLKVEEGQQTFRSLVEQADVVVENFAPGVVERLGLTYERLSAVNPRIIVASGRGFSEASVFRDVRAMDITVQAVSGIMSTNGYPDQPPVKTGPAVADFIAGTHLAVGVLAALFHRELTGAGQQVSVAMQDAVLPMLTSNIAGLLDTDGALPERVGNRHGGLSVAPYNVYPAKDGWFAILCIRERQWHNMCGAMGRDDLRNDPELSTPLGRVASMARIDEAIAAWTQNFQVAELAELLSSAEVPASPVRSLSQVLADEDLAARGIMFQRSSGNRTHHIFGSPIHLSKSPPVDVIPPPGLGEHTESVLRSLLGDSPDERSRAGS